MKLSSLENISNYILEYYLKCEEKDAGYICQKNTDSIREKYEIFINDSQIKIKYTESENLYQNYGQLNIKY